MSGNEVGLMLSTIRAARGLTQKQLSEMSGVAESYISSFETGTRRPSRYHVLKLEEALGIEFDDVKPAFDVFTQQVAKQ